MFIVTALGMQLLLEILKGTHPPQLWSIQGPVTAATRPRLLAFGVVQLFVLPPQLAHGPGRMEAEVKAKRLWRTTERRGSSDSYAS